jgi:hypothetical protein
LVSRTNKNLATLIRTSSKGAFNTTVKALEYEREHILGRLQTWWKIKNKQEMFTHAIRLKAKKGKDQKVGRQFFDHCAPPKKLVLHPFI